MGSSPLADPIPMRKSQFAQFGRLVYIAGASGSGKDALLDHARRADLPGVVFAHRYITRPLVGHGEVHIPLLDAEFDARLSAGLFALDWVSNGARYGVGTEIEMWLARGLHVVVNGSRAYLPVAQRRFPEMRIVWVTASDEHRRARLESRNREDQAAIEQRMVRGAAYRTPLATPHAVIGNDDEFLPAAERFVDFLRTLDAEAVRPPPVSAVIVPALEALHR